MHHRTAALASAVALLLAAPAAKAQDPQCSGTLSGAVQGAFDCTVTMEKAGPGTISLALAPAAKVAGTRAFAPGAIQLRGPLAARTYASGDLVRGKASLTTTKGRAFAATAGASGRGEVTLTIANLERYAQLPGRYVANGTYRARLVPAGKGRKGEVVVDVQFTVASDVLD
jgi:hypothetical protein